MKLEYKKIVSERYSKELDVYVYDIDFLRKSEKGRSQIPKNLDSLAADFIYKPTIKVREEIFNTGTTLKVDKDFYKLIDARIRTFIATHSGKNVVKRDIVGSGVSTGAFLSGAPKNMLNRKKTFGGKKKREEETHKQLFLVYDGRMSTIYRYTLPILGLVINALERDTNHRFQINIGEIGWISFRKRKNNYTGIQGVGPKAPNKHFNLANFITIKEYNQQFDFYDHFIWMTVPSFNKPVFIDFYEWFYKIDKDKMYPYDNDNNYETFRELFEPNYKLSLYMSKIDRKEFKELNEDFLNSWDNQEKLEFINNRLEDIILAWLSFFGVETYDY